MKKYLVTSYNYEENSAISEKIEGDLLIEGFNLIFKVDDTVVAVFEKNQVWVKEIKEEE